MKVLYTVHDTEPQYTTWHFKMARKSNNRLELNLTELHWCIQTSLLELILAVTYKNETAGLSFFLPALWRCVLLVQSPLPW